MPAVVSACECPRAVPNTKSHRSGCAERVKMSMWSWLILRISACAMAAVPAARRVTALPASASGSAGASAEPLGHATLGADIRQPPLSTVDGASRHGGEHRLEVLRSVLLAQRGRRSQLHDLAEVHDRQPLAVAFGLLHLVRGHHDGRARLG